MSRKPIIPVEIGQVRIDPDVRMLIRDVKIVDVAPTEKRQRWRQGRAETVDEEIVIIQRGGMSPKRRMLVRRIERWPVK
jgi:hypothetical protein